MGANADIKIGELLWSVSAFLFSSDASIVIPAKDVGSLSDEEIVAAVRTLALESRRLMAEEIIDKWEYYKEAPLESIERYLGELEPNVGYHYDIGCAVDMLRDRRGHILARKEGGESSPQKKGVNKGLRKRVMERDGYRCRHCAGWNDLTLDHIIPRSRGGETTYDNLQTLCRSCNSTKGTKVDSKGSVR